MLFNKLKKKKRFNSMRTITICNRSDEPKIPLNLFMKLLLGGTEATQNETAMQGQNATIANFGAKSQKKRTGIATH